MGHITLSIPTVGQFNSSEEPYIPAALTTIRDEINGNLDSSNLDALAVETANIDDGAVTTAKLDDLSVTTGKLGANAVTPDKMGDGASDVDFNSAVTLTTASTWYSIVSSTAPETGRYMAWGSILISNTGASSASLQCLMRDVVVLTPSLTFYQDKRFVGTITGIQWSVPFFRIIDLTVGDAYTIQAQTNTGLSTAPATQSYVCLNRIS